MESAHFLGSDGGSDDEDVLCLCVCWLKHWGNEVLSLRSESVLKCKQTKFTKYSFFMFHVTKLTSSIIHVCARVVFISLVSLFLLLALQKF